MPNTKEAREPEELVDNTGHFNHRFGNAQGEKNHTCTGETKHNKREI